MVQLDFAAVLVEWPQLLRGAGVTLLLTGISATLGCSLGVAAGWARANGPKPLAWLVATYVELIRNTPFVVQLFFLFFGLPSLGLRLTPEIASVLAMIINLGAYTAEITRAGIEATPKGQIEAAHSLAMNGWQTFVHVVLPPALARVWPALVGQIIIVMLGSAVCGQISTPEVSYVANLIQSRNFRAFESYLIVTAIYLLLAIAVRKLLNWAGPRFLLGHAPSQRRT
ncbi:amino acid ABC transporter permease [Curvibacter sp. CHRR-16]|uniref:amino acid ABC transporter permease n=1 Tax=Curvibacter sp. CHRR-16 TaxID=2835872 RepID=UPI001BDA6CFD|nr:amino acid ABC transporter permease [Curvibacter sp. CHRR-16]MBT0571304.1 amino acid ABC transporter permease [Curvibacter sp. CHRR-16]